MQQKAIWLGLVFTLLITALIYSFGLSGPFLLDDDQNLGLAKLSSYHITEVWNAIWSNEAGPLRRPVSMLSFVLNEAWLGSNPFDYKIVNLGLHLANGLLVFCIVSHLFSYLLNQPKDKVQSYALLVSALWLVHPLQVSTVLYAVQRMAILAAFFTLIGFGLYLVLRFKAHKNSQRIVLSVGILIAWLLAALSKENGLLLPFYFLTFELAYTLSHKETSKKYLKGMSLACGLIVLAGIGYYLHNWPLYAFRFEEKGFTLGEYILVQSQVLIFYLKLILLPKLSVMGLYQDDYFLKLPASIGLSISLLVTLFVIAIASLRSYPIIAFGIFWFFVSHGVESTVIPLEPVFEHRNYCALIGVLIALMGALEAILRNRAKNRVWRWTPALFVVLFLPITWARVDSWSDFDKFIAISKQYHPNSPRANIEWANIMIKRNQWQEARLALQRTQELAPRNSGPVVHELLTLCAIDGPKQKLLNKSNQALKNQVISIYTIFGLDALTQQVFNQKCHYLTPAEVLPLLDAALTNPGIAMEPKFQAMLHHFKAGILIALNNKQQAIQSLDLAYQLNPDKVQPLIEKTYLLITLNEMSKAQQSLTFIHKLPKSKLPSIREKLKPIETLLE